MLPRHRDAGAVWRTDLLTLKPNCLLFLALRLHAVKVGLFPIDEGLEAIPFGGNPFCASGVEDEEMIAVVGCMHPY